MSEPFARLTRMGRADYQTCARGHAWTEENTGYRVGSEARYCRTCQRQAQAVSRAKAAGRPLPDRDQPIERVLYPDGLKRCSDCGDARPVSEFSGQAGRHVGGRCTSCAVKAAKAWELANPERAAETRVRGMLRRTYGISLERYQQILVDQGGGCAICGAAQSIGNGTRLHVDHKPGTRVVRGLLCNHCNGGIARFRDDPTRIRAAVDYLKRAR